MCIRAPLIVLLLLGAGNSIVFEVLRHIDTPDISNRKRGFITFSFLDQTIFRIPVLNISYEFFLLSTLNDYICLNLNVASIKAN